MESIIVYADLLCPFTHAGLHTLLDRRAMLGVTVPQLDIRAWPLELVNGQPLDAHHVAAEIVGMRATVCPDLFEGFSVVAFPSTAMVAYSLTVAAAATRDISLIEAVGMALRDAVFEEGLDIADGNVIADLARGFGLDPTDRVTTEAAVRSDWAQGKRQGVVGSPHFFVGAENYFCPGLDISRDEHGVFHIAWKPNAQEFFDRAFGG